MEDNIGQINDAEMLDRGENSVQGDQAAVKSPELEASGEQSCSLEQPVDMITDKQGISGASSDSSIDSSIRIKMLARVALSDAHFRHQQIGEPDLTLEEKVEIAQSIFDRSKVAFLSKYWKYLEVEDLVVFQDLRHVYEVDFYIKQVMKLKNKGVQKNRVKNRRYEAMKELISEGEYFSEEEMKFREPYLYEQFIGQYLTDDEIQAKVDKTDLTFSNILLKHIDQLDENARYGHAKDVEVRVS